MPRFPLYGTVAALLALACTEPHAPEAAQLAFLLHPADATAGSAFQVTVEVQDRSGQRVTSATPTISVALGNNPGGASLAGTRTVAAVAGVATFTSLSLDKASAAYTLTASATGLTTATSSSFAITAAAPSKLAFVVVPTPQIVAGVVLTPSPAVAVQDPFGNTVVSATNSVTIGLNTSPFGATLSGTRAVAPLNGIATFSDLRLDKTGSYTLIASSAALISAGTGVLNVLAGPASKLGFLIEPGAALTDTPFSPPVLVEIRDAGGNRVLSSTAVITLTLGTNPGGAILSGTRTVAAVNGLASFSDLSLNALGTGYTLVASSAGVTSATSGPFVIRLPLDFTAVSAGYFHACGLALGSVAHCWGDNGGKLGNGTEFPSGVPVAVSGGISFVSVSAGRNHSCGLTAAGVGYCWGQNGNGELGDGTTTARLTPTPVAGGLSFASITAGYDHTCGITLAGLAYCWGGNLSGQVGDGSTTNRLAPAAVSPALTWLVLRPGRSFSCGVATTHAAYCWGTNVAGMLGTGTTTASTIPVGVAGGLSFSWIGAGGFHACGLTLAGAAYCWGSSGFGEVGDGATTQRNAPVPVSGGLTFASLSVGNRHNCAVTAAGVAYCWGDNTDRNLGNGTADGIRTVPGVVAGGLSFASVSAGRFHSCGVTTSNLAYCWGANFAGQLGSGVSDVSSVPVRVK